MEDGRALGRRTWNASRMDAIGSRRAHAELLLKAGRDLWLATSSTNGPHLVPLSYVWHQERLLMATSARSTTGRNLLENGRARAAVGVTRDLVIVVGPASAADAEDTVLSTLFEERLRKASCSF